MTAALHVLPLMLVVLDEILIRQRPRPVDGGAGPALLFFGQFFLSTELLAITALVAVIGIVVLVAAALVLDRAELRRRAPHALRGLAVAAGSGWRCWPGRVVRPRRPRPPVRRDLAQRRRHRRVPPAQLHVSPLYPQGGNDIDLALGGYEGRRSASGGFSAGGSSPCWPPARPLLARPAHLVLRLHAPRLRWFSIGHPPGGTLGPSSPLRPPAAARRRIEQRFLAFGFLFAAVAVALVLDHVHEPSGDWCPRRQRPGGGRRRPGAHRRPPSCPGLPFTMRAVSCPAGTARWRHPAPRAGAAADPAPFSGIQSAMSWQAVNRMHYSQAGGGGPRGRSPPGRSAAPGFRLISAVGFGVGVPLPPARPAHSPRCAMPSRCGRSTPWWVPTDPARRRPTGARPDLHRRLLHRGVGAPAALEAGAWVWDNVQLGPARSHPLGHAGPLRDPGRGDLGAGAGRSAGPVLRGGRRGRLGLRPCPGRRAPGAAGMTPRRALGRGPHTVVGADFGAKVVPFAMPPQDPTPQLHRPAWPAPPCRRRGRGPPSPGCRGYAGERRGSGPPEAPPAEVLVEGIPAAMSLAPNVVGPALGGETCCSTPRPARGESMRAGLLQAGPLAIAGRAGQRGQRGRHGGPGPVAHPAQLRGAQPAHRALPDPLHAGLRRGGGGGAPGHDDARGRDRPPGAALGRPGAPAGHHARRHLGRRRLRQPSPHGRVAQPGQRDRDRRHPGRGGVLRVPLPRPRPAPGPPGLPATGRQPAGRDGRAPVAVLVLVEAG